MYIYLSHAIFLSNKARMCFIYFLCFAFNAAGVIFPLLANCFISTALNNYYLLFVCSL